MSKPAFRLIYVLPHLQDPRPDKQSPRWLSCVFRLVGVYFLSDYSNTLN